MDDDAINRLIGIERRFLVHADLLVRRLARVARVIRLATEIWVPADAQLLRCRRGQWVLLEASHRTVGIIYRRVAGGAVRAEGCDRVILGAPGALSAAAHLLVVHGLISPVNR